MTGGQRRGGAGWPVTDRQGRGGGGWPVTKWYVHFSVEQKLHRVSVSLPSEEWSPARVKVASVPRSPPKTS